MNLDHLRNFIELARTGSFSEVARRLSISQPAVSFQVQRLERELGVRLIDRSQKVVRLTPAGQRLLRFAESVVGERQQMAQDLDRLREDIAGDLTIASSTIPGEFLLPSWLAEFSRLHPAVTARVEISDSLTVIGSARDNVGQVGFCGIAPEGQDLAFFKVAEDQIVLIVYPEHPLAARQTVSLADLESEPLISREANSGTQRTMEARASAAGFDLSKWGPRLVLGSTQAVVGAVESKAGIAFVSDLAIRKSLALGLVRQVPVSDVNLRRDFYCVYRENALLSRLLDEFISFMRAESSR